MHRLGRIPQEGDTVEIDGVRLTAEAVENRRVIQVCVALPPGEAA
jgi:CBS domain containing-hemolysin-like protein